MGKYEPLAHFLGSQRSTRVRASFAEIERVLGFKLPKSAQDYEAWWSNNDVGHSHARAWLDGGWRTEGVNLSRREVTFVRAGPIASGADRNVDPWACMAGTLTIMPGTDLTAPTEDEQWNAERGIVVNE